MPPTDPTQPEPDYHKREIGKAFAFALCAIFSLFGLAAIVGLLFLFKDNIPF